MSFFGLFGSSESSQGNKALREHLKKCAGLGQLPPPIDCEKVNAPCKKKEEEKVEVECRPKVMPPVFVPNCNVPPTATFKCPAEICEACDKKEEEQKKVEKKAEAVAKDPNMCCKKR